MQGRIRSIVTSDIQAIWELNQSMVPAVGSVDIERMALLVATCEHALAVESVLDEGATGDLEILGFSLVFAPGSSYDSNNYRWFAERYPDAHYLDRVAFRPSAQGQGMGKALYLHIEGLLRLAGVGQISLEVNVEPPNVRSLAFHKGQGYLEVGQQQTAYGTRVSMQVKQL